MEVVTLDRKGDCDILMDLARDELPRLDYFDVCVSNAAVTTTIAPAHEMTAEQWSRDIDVNLTGAFRVIQACLRGMLERRSGRVVVVSSAAALRGLPGQVAYTASKAGLLGMVRTLAAETIAHGITVNAILPGMVATEKVLAMPQDVLERITAELPTGQMIEPAELAELVAFLTSDLARSISGQSITVDGGRSLGRVALSATAPV
jgi:NAD(P)-dependent dehydrogenase (short-subunit alcohol dehydrogenase family)